MPKVGYRSEIDHCFFLPRSIQSGATGGQSFILFILLADDQSLAFRFDPAEAGGKRHDYAHMQFCRTLNDVDLPFIEIPDWVPQRDPAFPLPSSDPVKLFLVMATAVHGRSGGVVQVIIDIFQQAGKTEMTKTYIDLLTQTLD